VSAQIEKSEVVAYLLIGADMKNSGELLPEIREESMSVNLLIFTKLMPQTLHKPSFANTVLSR